MKPIITVQDQVDEWVKESKAMNWRKKMDELNKHHISFKNHGIDSYINDALSDLRKREV